MVKRSKQGVSKCVNNTFCVKKELVNSTPVHKVKASVFSGKNQNNLQSKRVIQKTNTGCPLNVKRQMQIDSVFKIPVQNKFESLCHLESECVESLHTFQPVQSKTVMAEGQTVTESKRRKIGKKEIVSITEPTKYELSIMTVVKKKEKMQKARSLACNKLFLKQNKGQFGFIPLSPLPEKISDCSKNKPMNVIEAHKLLKKDSRPNYKGLQIPVQSDFKAEKFFNFSQLQAFGCHLCIQP